MPLPGSHEEIGGWPWGGRLKSCLLENELLFTVYNCSRRRKVSVLLLVFLHVSPFLKESRLGRGRWHTEKDRSESIWVLSQHPLVHSDTEKEHQSLRTAPKRCGDWVCLPPAQQIKSKLLSSLTKLLSSNIRNSRGSWRKWLEACLKRHCGVWLQKTTEAASPRHDRQVRGGITRARLVKFAYRCHPISSKG